MAEGDGADKPDAEQQPGAEQQADAGQGPEEEKKTSGALSALLPIIFATVAIGFVIYPYIQDVRERGPQPIENAKPRASSAQGEQTQQPADVLAPEAKQLLAGLDVGKKLEGFEIIGVRGPLRKRLEVEVKRDNATMRIFVVKKGTTSFPPPKETKQYGVFYANARPSPELVSNQEAIDLVNAVGKVVEANEGQTSMPEGL